MGVSPPNCQVRERMIEAGDAGPFRTDLKMCPMMTGSKNADSDTLGGPYRS